MDDANKKFIKESLTQLQRTAKSTLYAILDGALIDSLENQITKLTQNNEATSLYEGTKHSHLSDVAPYLIQLHVNHPLLDWWLDNGWDKHWGILCTSNSDLNSLATHFKKLLTVNDHNKNEVLFRFYDPRVIGVFLLTCTDDNYLEFEGPVNNFCIEDKLSGFKIIQRRKFKVESLEF